MPARPQKPWIGVDQRRRQHARRQQPLLAIHIAQDCIQQTRPLDQPGLESLEFRLRQRQRNRIESPGIGRARRQTRRKEPSSAAIRSSRAARSASVSRPSPASTPSSPRQLGRTPRLPSTISSNDMGVKLACCARRGKMLRAVAQPSPSHCGLRPRSGREECSGPASQWTRNVWVHS